MASIGPVDNCTIYMQSSNQTSQPATFVKVHAAAKVKNVKSGVFSAPRQEESKGNCDGQKTLGFHRLRPAPLFKPYQDSESTFAFDFQKAAYTTTFRQKLNRNPAEAVGYLQSNQNKMDLKLFEELSAEYEKTQKDLASNFAVKAVVSQNLSVVNASTASATLTASHVIAKADASVAMESTLDCPFSQLTIEEKRERISQQIIEGNYGQAKQWISEADLPSEDAFAFNDQIAELMSKK